MINLITTETKLKLKKIFYLRLIVTFLLTLSISLFLVTLIIMPLFVFSTVEKKREEQKLEKQKNDNISFSNNETEILLKDIENKMSILNSSREDKSITSSEILNKIISKKIEGIRIKEINFFVDSLNGKTLELRGNAFSRDILLSFQNLLEKDKDFTKVNLPISNFIEKNNINFNLVLLLP